MSGQVEKIVLRELDEEKFIDNITDSLREDNISESCYTNFKDVLVDTIVQMISEITKQDFWELEDSVENSKEEIFNAFMKNSEFKILIEEEDNILNEIVVKLDFTENEKKKIAETYIDNILEGYYYLDICLFVEVGEEVNVDTVSKILSNEVYGLLSPEEIKAKFKDKIEEAINIVFNYDADYDVDCNIDDEEE